MSNEIRLQGQGVGIGLGGVCCGPRRGVPPGSAPAHPTGRSTGATYGPNRRERGSRASDQADQSLAADFEVFADTLTLQLDRSRYLDAETTRRTCYLIDRFSARFSLASVDALCVSLTEASFARLILSDDAIVTADTSSVHGIEAMLEFLRTGGTLVHRGHLSPDIDESGAMWSSPVLAIVYRGF